MENDGEMMEKKICKICNKPELVEFINFGQMPVANAFLKKENLSKPEFTYEMAVGFCENCKMVQLINLVPYDKYIIPDETGRTNYAFFSSTSKFMEKHFAELASEVEKRFLDEKSKVLEIGSVAISQGIETIKDFFTEELAKKIVRDKGKFKAILTTNVFLNIINIHNFLKGVNYLLDNKGVFITEDPYLLEILEKNSYDQIYDEHIWYFSLTSLSNLLKEHNLEIFDAEKQEVHGGSMRVYIAKINDYEKTERLKKYLEVENEKNIGSLEPYQKFAIKVQENKKKFTKLLKDLKQDGKKIVGYAAASKGTIVQNYCNIGPEILDYISDSTPAKQGLFSPGKHIPIVSPDKFHKDNADYVVLGAWNHAKEILQKEENFIKKGGRFIVHLPEPKIIKSINDLDKSKDSKFDKLIEIKDLKIWADDQGYLFETIRADDKIFEGKFGQVLVSVLYPGTIKGLHKHEKQTDYTTCIKGNIKYVAVLENNGEIKIKTFIIGERNPILIKTPPGIWHGYMPLANKEAIVLHLMDKTFDPKNDDTQRKDPFAFGDVWSVKAK